MVLSHLSGNTDITGFLGVQGTVMISFNGFNTPKEIILQAVRWYLAYALSYRDIEELLVERGLQIDHSTINRWVMKFSPQLEAEFHQRKRRCNGRLRLDETSIKVKGEWVYLYQAVDSSGKTVDFLLTKKRKTVAAKRFLKKLIDRNGLPSLINIDKSGANKAAIKSIIVNTIPASKCVSVNT